MSQFVQDLKFAVRSFAKNPGATLLAIATLALGIGANAAIFSVVHRVLIAPLPYPAADRVVIPWRTNVQLGGLSITPSYSSLQKWRTASSVEALTMYSMEEKVIVSGDEPRTVAVYEIEPGLLDFTGARPRLGRPFNEDDASSEAAAKVLLLTEATWRTDFGADPQIVGRRIQLSDQTYEIIGVLPADFRLPRSRPDMLAPLPPPPPPKDGHIEDIRVSAMIRLKPGVSPNAAAAELAGTGVEPVPADDDTWPVRLAAASDMAGTTLRRALLMLSGAVGFVLLIACANVANLVLARNAAREREIAVRVALGAGRGRLVRQLLTENLLLAAVGGAAGLGLGVWALQAITALRPPDMNELQNVSLSRETLAFGFGVSLFTGLLFGLAPAIAATRTNLSEGLKQGTRSMGGIRGQAARRSLSVAEVALALMLLSGAGLLIRSYARLQAADLGFDPERVLAVQVALPETRYATAASRNEFFSRFSDLVRAQRGTRSVALALGAPPHGGLMFGQLEIRDRELPPDQPAAFGGGWVSAGYFETLRIQIREGRAFILGDEKNPDAAIVNEMFAKQYWPGESALGKQLRMGPKSPWRTVVGVVGSVKPAANVRPRLQIYFPLTSASTFDMTLLVATTGDPIELVAAIKGLAWSIDPKLPMRGIETVEARVAETLARPRFNLVLLSAFAGLGLVLAAIGIYGVISYGVGMRTREIGVRMALGALPVDIRKTIIKEALVLTGIGTAIGLGGSLALSRLLQTLLFEVSATDPWTFIAVAGILSGAALLAAWLPARRAMRVDPMVALRAE